MLHKCKGTDLLEKRRTFHLLLHEQLCVIALQTPPLAAICCLVQALLRNDWL